MKIKSRLTFTKESDSLVQSPVLITGVNRSGTTLAGNIIGSFTSMEYEYEPALLSQIPLLEKWGLIDEEAAVETIHGFCTELLNDRVLGRGVNCRPSDDSSIWKRVSPNEVFYKWLHINSRQDVKKVVREKNISLCMKVVNLLPFIPFFFKAYPDLRLIHIVRSPFDTALSIAKKGWVSEDNLRNTEGASISKEICLSSSGRKVIVPWWVEDADTESFLKSSEFERALYCWSIQFEKFLEYKRELTSKFPKQYLEVKFEDLITNPQSFVEKIAVFTGAKSTSFTKKLIGEIDLSKVRSDNTKYPIAEVAQKESDRVRRIMQELGYSTTKKSQSKSKIVLMKK